MDTLTMALTGQFIADKRMEDFRKPGGARLLMKQ